jgi:hypothetical protein
MKRRSLKNAAIAITVLVLGVTLVNLTIKASCYLLLAMFKNPFEAFLLTVGVMGIIYMIDRIIQSNNK